MRGFLSATPGVHHPGERTVAICTLKGDDVSYLLEPGMRVRHPGQPDWGIGQIQSVIGDRITVNFENAGKVLINAAVVELEPLVE
jgi:FKBP-type peptidyl-prolyl cis-trans isomerase 2